MQSNGNGLIAKIVLHPHRWMNRQNKYNNTKQKHVV